MSLDSLQQGAQRRKSPRIELDTPVHGVDLATGRKVEALDLSHGGFRTLSPTPGTPGMCHTFRFSLRTGATCDVRAAAVHSHRAPGNSRAFVVGWRAMSDPESRAGLGRLIADVMTVADDARASEDQEAPAPTTGGQS